MNLIIFGPPGAGKGTQSNLIAKKYGFFQISTGEILRNQIKMKTDLGVKIAPMINEGLFVSDEIVSDLIEKVIKDKKYNNKMIFDGYPRSLSQAAMETLAIISYHQPVTRAEIEKIVSKQQH